MKHTHIKNFSFHPHSKQQELSLLLQNSVWRKQFFADKSLKTNKKKWLFDTGSLTQKVLNYCQQQQASFSLTVVRQEVHTPSVEEALVLGLKLRQKAIIREVQLCCDNRPLIFARTVLPFKLLTGKEKRLAHTGNKPLGAYLFAQVNLHRQPLEISKIKYANEDYWARRSIFSLNNKSLLIYELFLSDF